MTLPPAVGNKVGAALQTLAGLDQTTAGLLAGVGLGLPALLAWNAAYGGFAGNLEPEETLQLLQVMHALACRSLQQLDCPLLCLCSAPW